MNKKLFCFRLGDGSSNRQHDPMYHYKTCSLPAASSINQSWDEVICSALRISPEDIANQLTLLDLPCFKAIQPEELTTCGWNKLNKLTVAPNVVAFTKRFNRVWKWECLLYLLLCIAICCSLWIYIYWHAMINYKYFTGCYYKFYVC